MRTFGPKSANHPSVGTECPACHKPFAAGDYTTLVSLGPGDDPEEQQKAREGRPYNAVAAEVHATCAGIPEPEEPRALVRREFELNEEQLAKILDASKPTPVMFGSGGVSLFSTPQENANRAWAEVGKELGFKPMTVQPVRAKGQRFFTAEVA